MRKIRELIMRALQKLMVWVYPIDWMLEDMAELMGKIDKENMITKSFLEGHKSELKKKQKYGIN
jgi:hypothetical protein